MLIDMHAHSSGISRCCQIPAEQVVQEVKNAGMDGIVLTNHYVVYYAKDGEHFELAERYIKEFEYAKRCGEKIGVKVFFGIEVTMELEGHPHVLVYGVEPNFILKHYKIFDYSQQELYNCVKQAGGVVVQAHPFRGNEDRLLDLNLLDGIEINCHPLYEGTHSEKILAIATKNNLLVTSGGDYHADTHRAKCGMYFPDSLQNGVELGNYLKSEKYFKLCIQEVDEFVSKDIEYALK